MMNGALQKAVKNSFCNTWKLHCAFLQFPKIWIGLQMFDGNQIMCFLTWQDVLGTHFLDCKANTISINKWLMIKFICIPQIN